MAEISTHTHIHTGRFRAMSRYRVPRENSSQRHTEGRFSAAPDNFVQCRDFGDLRGLGASGQASSLARCRTACGCTINHSERIERGQNCTPIGGHFSTPIDIIDPAWHQEVCNFQPPYLCNFRPPLTAIAHLEEGKRVLDRIRSQGHRAPFDPRIAVKRFSELLHAVGVTHVVGDAYGGETFRADFREHGIEYVPSTHTKHDLYEAFEPLLNAGEVELLDHPKLTEQLQTLVWRGRKIDHVSGDHDDWANAC